MFGIRCCVLLGWVFALVHPGLLSQDEGEKGKCQKGLNMRNHELEASYSHEEINEFQRAFEEFDVDNSGELLCRMRGDSLRQSISHVASMHRISKPCRQRP